MAKRKPEAPEAPVENPSAEVQVPVHESPQEPNPPGTPDAPVEIAADADDALSGHVADPAAYDAALAEETLIELTGGPDVEPEVEPEAEPEGVVLVKMIRDAEGTGGPTSADVHPLEVDNMIAGNWRVAE